MGRRLAAAGVAAAAIVSVAAVTVVVTDGDPEMATAVDPNPQNCQGYPEPRVWHESQAWWTQDSDLENPLPDDELNGHDEHTHLGVCLPAPGVAVDGVVRFDLVWQLHEMDDGYVKRFRIQHGSQTLVTVNADTATQSLCLGETHCGGVQTINLNVANLPTGSHEFRFHNESERTDDSGALATNGWHVCVRSCSPVVAHSGRAVSPPVEQGRNRWFETMIGDPDDYGYVVSQRSSPYPADENGYTPLSGNWCPIIRTREGSPNESPVVRSFVAVDPRFHDYSVEGFPDGWPGDVLVDQAGKIDRLVCVDTTKYTDGLHTLYIRADGQAPTGKQGGVYAFRFLVANNGAPPPPTTTATEPTTTEEPPPTTTTAPSEMTVAVSQPRPGQNVNGFIGLRVSYTGPVVKVEYFVDGVEVAEDTSAPDFDEPWQSDSVPVGSHTITARATDAAGAAVESAPVTFATE